MSRFLITMNMPTRNGSSVHQIIAEHPARTLSEFVSELERSEFVIVQEFYKEAPVVQPGSSARRSATGYFPSSEIAINYRYIGKINLDE